MGKQLCLKSGTLSNACNSIKKRRSYKICKIDRKTSMPESFFTKVAGQKSMKAYQNQAK